MDMANEADCYPPPPRDISSKHYSINGHSITSKCHPNIPHSTMGFKHILLTIQLDALSALVDEQATRRLWKLFTNCAGSIAHGRRLENLSWRSWGRDQSLMHQAREELHPQPKVPTSNREEEMAKDEWQKVPSLNDNNGAQLGLEYRPLVPACSTPEKERQFECTGCGCSSSGSGSGCGMRTPRISSSPPTTRSLGSRDGDGNDDNHIEGGSRCRTIHQGQDQRLDEASSSSTSIPSLSHSSTSTSTSTLMSTTTIATSTLSAKLSFPRFESSTVAPGEGQTSASTSETKSSSSPLLSPPPPPNSFAVSRSPPLGPLIKRVIFTPPRPSDHAAAALEELMSSVEGRLCAMEQRRQDRGPELLAAQNEEGRRHPTPRLSSPSQATTFPTVVILESTPKPTPPDTPARGLSPSSDAQRSIFHFQTLSPLHALINPNQVASPDSDQPGLLLPNSTTTSLNSQAVLDPSPAPRLTPMVPTSESSSSTSPPNATAATAVVENIKAPVPSAPGINRAQIHHEPHSLDSRTSSPEHLALLLNPPTATTVSRHDHSNSDGGAVVVGGMAPTTSHRMFFLQRDSSSLSPDSNSRSGSHSRSPASRSPDVHVVHGPLNQAVPGVAVREDGGAVSQTERNVLEAETKMEKIASESKQNPKRDVTTAISRELPEESSARPSPLPADEQPSISVPNASSSSSSHTHHPNRQQRLVMRSKKGGYRPHLGRAHHERPSSRTSARASVGSRGSGSTSTTAGGRSSAGAGSVDANAGSTSASGMGSMSTSAGSKLVMKRHPRTHSPLRNSVPVSDVAAAALPPSTQRGEQPPVASGSGQQQNFGKKVPHVSPLAVLPDPLRMEVLERQVMQTAMKSQSAGRKISLESDSEDDYTDDDEVEVDESDDDEDIVVVKGAQKDTGKITQRAVVEEEDGSSWSDEDEGEVIVAKKRSQAQQQKHSGPLQPPSRRNSKDLDHLVGSAGSGRESHEHAKSQAHLPHVKSKGKIAHNHHHAHVQRQQLSPPLRPAVARKASAGHTRSAPSQDGPLAQAAREALRQRDMFTPLPRETYSSTNLVREKSRTSLSRGGRPSNLTMLLNPDPQLFPQNHPYRQDVHPMDQKLSRSMEELYARGNGNRSPGGSGSGVKSPRPGIGLGFGGLKMTTTAQPTPRTQVPTPAPAPAPAPVTKSASPDEPLPSRRLSSLDKSPPPRAPLTKLRLSKSAIAVPAVTGVTASSTPRNEKQADILEMSLRQMGPAQRRPRVTRHAQEPARPQLERRTSDQQRDQRESDGTPSSRPSNRLGAKPADIEFSDTEDEAPSSPPPKVAGTSGRSLAKEHLEAVMGGKVRTGMSASRTVVASPDAVPKESRESDPTSYRPPAPPSSPSVYNAHEAKRPQGHLPHTPPSSKRPPVARAPRNRPHSSHGQPTAPVVSPTPPTTVAPQRERRQAATSQPPIPVTTAPVHAVAPYPYNLPYPAPLQSPRTTRLNMLASEVPDDLRKDLLWERKTNRIAPMLDNRAPTPLAPLRRNANAVAGGLRPMTNITASGGAEGDEASEQARLEREAQERYDRMRTQTWNGVIYQRPVW